MYQNVNCMLLKNCTKINLNVKTNILNSAFNMKQRYSQVGRLNITSQDFSKNKMVVDLCRAGL